MFYLSVVGYKSIVAELTTFTEIEQDKNQRNKIICRNGMSINTQAIPLNPVVNNIKTDLKEEITVCEF